MTRPRATVQKLPIEGSQDSPVRVESFEDLQCPDTAAYRRMLDQTLLPRFGREVGFASFDFPLDNHAWALPAAMAARRFAITNAAAGINFRRFCLFNIREISVENLADRIAEFARSHGLDEEDAVLALRSDDLRAAVLRDHRAGEKRGVSKTPSVFVGKKLFVETFAPEELAEAIEAALRSKR